VNSDKKVPTFGKKPSAGSKRPVSPVKTPPEEKKPRKAPAKRTDKEVPDMIISDILDTLSASNKADTQGQDLEGLIEDVVSQYEKMRDSSKPAADGK
jgi:hypothetical protein